MMRELRVGDALVFCCSRKCAEPTGPAVPGEINIFKALGSGAYGSVSAALLDRPSAIKACLIRGDGDEGDEHADAVGIVRELMAFSTPRQFLEPGVLMRGATWREFGVAMPLHQVSMGNRALPAQIPLSLLKLIGRQIAAQVWGMHAADLMHRDIKNHNIMLSVEAPVPEAQWCCGACASFHPAHVTQDAALQHDGFFLRLKATLVDYSLAVRSKRSREPDAVTLWWRPRELLECAAHRDPSCSGGDCYARIHDASVDVYSLGVVLLNAAVGRYVTNASSNAGVLRDTATNAPRMLAVVAAMDAPFSALLRKMLSPLPAARPTAAQVLHSEAMRPDYGDAHACAAWYATFRQLVPPPLAPDFEYQRFGAHEVDACARAVAPRLRVAALHAATTLAPRSRYAYTLCLEAVDRMARIEEGNDVLRLALALFIACATSHDDAARPKTCLTVAAQALATVALMEDGGDATRIAEELLGGATPTDVLRVLDWTSFEVESVPMSKLLQACAALLPPRSERDLMASVCAAATRERRPVSARACATMAENATLIAGVAMACLSAAEADVVSAFLLTAGALDTVLKDGAPVVRNADVLAEYFLEASGSAYSKAARAWLASERHWISMAQF